MRYVMVLIMFLGFSTSCGASLTSAHKIYVQEKSSLYLDIDVSEEENSGTLSIPGEGIQDKYEVGIAVTGMYKDKTSLVVHVIVAKREDVTGDLKFFKQVSMALPPYQQTHVFVGESYYLTLLWERANKTTGTVFINVVSWRQDLKD